MKLIHLLLAVALAMVLTVAGCAGAPPKPAHLTVHQTIEVLCISAGASYGAIGKINAVHAFSASVQANASKAHAETDKVCKLGPGEDYPNTLEDAALSALKANTATLAKIQGEGP